MWVFVVSGFCVTNLNEPTVHTVHICTVGHRTRHPARQCDILYGAYSCGLCGVVSALRLFANRT